MPFLSSPQSVYNGDLVIGSSLSLSNVLLSVYWTRVGVCSGEGNGASKRVIGDDGISVSESNIISENLINDSNDTIGDIMMGICIGGIRDCIW